MIWGRGVGVVAIILAIAGCRGDGRRSPARDAEAEPTDARIDATWRAPDVLGRRSDIMALFDRDCPPDTPPMDKHGHGRDKTLMGIICSAPVERNLWRWRRIRAHEDGESMLYVSVGWEWIDRPYPAECERAKHEDLIEYYQALVRSPDTGKPPTRLDVEDVRRALAKGGDFRIMTSTGPIYVTYRGNVAENPQPGVNTCTWTMYDGRSDEARFAYERDAGVEP